MRLIEYLELCKEEVEVTVYDRNYDMEVYFYNGSGAWNHTMKRLASKLEVVHISNNGLTVNFSDVIESNLEAIQKADLFHICDDVEDIMDSIESILSGNVSEKWFKKFVNCLEKV